MQEQLARGADSQPSESPNTYSRWTWEANHESRAVVVAGDERQSCQWRTARSIDAWLEQVYASDRAAVKAWLESAARLSESWLSYRLKEGPGELTVCHVVRGAEGMRTTGVIYPQHLANKQSANEMAQTAMTDRMATIGMLSAGVAHEINNPLSYILSNLKFAVEALDSTRALPLSVRQEVEEPLRDALDGAEKVRNIVRDLKTFARPDSEKLELVDVRSVIESAINLSWNEIRHRARLVKTLEEVPPILASESRLAQVFLNLLVNAAQAIPPGFASENRVSVQLRHESGRVLITISDTGSGIRPEDRARLFEPFFTTKSKSVGTGLGLPICRQYVTQMLGEISFESEVGKGTSFSVSFPASSTASATSKPKVVAIDDDMNVLKALRRMLSRDYEVFTFQDGESAVESIEALRPELILCDVAMPDMGGDAVLAALKQRNQELVDKFAFITGASGEGRVKQVLKGSSRPYLEKPFDGGAVSALFDVMRHPKGKN